MKCMSTLMAVSIALLVSYSAAAAVENEAIESAAKEYQRLLQESRDAGNRPGVGDMGDFVDEAFAQIPIEELTLEQMSMIFDKVPVQFSTRTNLKLDQHLEQMAQARDADGARAAVLRLRTQSHMVKSPQKLPRLKAALEHPGLPQAIAAGSGAEIFSTAAELAPEDRAAVREQINALADAIGPDAHDRLFASGAMLIIRSAKPVDGESPRDFEPLRQQLSAALAQKLASAPPQDDRQRERLEQVQAQLDGAFARGELLGHPAPEITFAWYHNPANPDEKISSLSDLKGKVVVLDFWATWCGPCIASFPNVKALHNYYRGYDVVVIGVTSLQGSHSGRDGRVDTRDDPHKEHELMLDFIDWKSMTWPVAFSEQPVFNPEYGVMGIPNVVIIDPDGIVRHAGLHPAGELKDKTKLIDKLLAESGLIIPATMLEMRKPDPGN